MNIFCALARQHGPRFGNLAEADVDNDTAAFAPPSLSIPAAFAATEATRLTIRRAIPKTSAAILVSRIRRWQCTRSTM